MSETQALEVSLHVAADPEVVFPYFTDPERYVLWMGRTALLDAVPGGEYRVQMGDGVAALGTFIEVDPPRRLVFTWGWTAGPDVPPGSTRVEVSLTAEAGGTRVVLRHHDLPDLPMREHHRAGWEMYLARLGAVLIGGDPRPDPNA